MQLELPKNISHAGALRYLGAAGQPEDAATETLLGRAQALLLPACTPRGCWRELPLSALPLERAGADLARHLAGCDGLVLMAVTLGSGVDQLLRRLCLQDIALGAAADALASALMEELCDALEGKLRSRQRQQARYITGRYSPGYGDCPLALQKELCTALDTLRSIGLAPTAENLLTPRKSVTAILGTADAPVTGARAGCGHCLLLKTCAYRKRGTTCAD